MPRLFTGDEDSVNIRCFLLDRILFPTQVSNLQYMKIMHRFYHSLPRKAFFLLYSFCQPHKSSQIYHSERYSSLSNLRHILDLDLSRTSWYIWCQGWTDVKSIFQSASNTWVIIHQTLLTHQKRKKEKRKRKNGRALVTTTLVGNCNIEFQYWIIYFIFEDFSMLKMDIAQIF